MYKSYTKTVKKEGGHITLEEIKRATHIHAKNITNGIDTSEYFLAWFDTVPAELQGFTCEVFSIFEKLHTGQITIQEAKAQYDAAAGKLDI